MEEFTSLAIRCDGNKKHVSIAGLNTKWNREMVICNGNVPEQLKNHRMMVVCPAGKTNGQSASAADLLEREQVKIGTCIDPAVSTAEFYRRQKAFGNNTRDIIVVDVSFGYTDISWLKNGVEFSVKRSQRLDQGLDMLTDTIAEKFGHHLTANRILLTDAVRKNLYVEIENQLVARAKKRSVVRERFYYESGGKQFSLTVSKDDFQRLVRSVILPILNDIERMTYCNRIAQPVILLSGRIWMWQDAVQIMKDRFVKWNIFSYRPESAALLGAVCYGHRKCPSTDTYSLPDDYFYYYEDMWGEVCNLTDLQRDDYWEMLRAIRDKNKEITIRGTEKEFYSIYWSIRNDFPEIRTLLDHDHLTYMVIKDRKSPKVKVNLVYDPAGDSLMKQIDMAAERNLKACMGWNGGMSDDEIIRRVYCYMSEHYRYAKEETASGKYPGYTYTLETLLKSGVCDGYAISMVYMLRKLQIPFIYVLGDADVSSFECHAWNMVSTIEGTYRHIDLTWDLGKGENENKMKYLILDDISMRAHRHFWDINRYPACV